MPTPTLHHKVSWTMGRGIIYYPDGKTVKLGDRITPATADTTFDQILDHDFVASVSVAIDSADHGGLVQCDGVSRVRYRHGSTRVAAWHKKRASGSSKISRCTTPACSTRSRWRLAHGRDRWAEMAGPVRRRAAEQRSTAGPCRDYPAHERRRSAGCRCQLCAGPIVPVSLHPFVPALSACFLAPTAAGRNKSVRATSHSDRAGGNGGQNNRSHTKPTLTARP